MGRPRGVSAPPGLNLPRNYTKPYGRLRTESTRSERDAMTRGGSIVGGDELPAGWALRRARKERGLSQERLSELSGVAQHTISDAERGRHYPQRVTLEKLARAMGMELEDLTRSPSPPPEDVSGWALEGTDEDYERRVRRATLQTIRGGLMPFLSGAIGAAKVVGDAEAARFARERWRVASREWQERVGGLREGAPTTPPRPASPGERRVDIEETA